MTQMDQRNQLVPYWDSSVEDGSQAAFVDQFSRDIYPIWKPIFEREFESQDYDDMKTVHLADVEIHASGIKPRRFMFSAESAAKEEKKQRMKSKYESVMND